MLRHCTENNGTGPHNKRMQLPVWPVTTLAGRAGNLAATRPLGQGRASPARS
jgi:hypothetical protein